MTAAEAADKVRKLRAVARGAAGTPEAETAAALAARLVAKYGLEGGTPYRAPYRTQEPPPRERAAAGYGSSAARPQGRRTVDGVRSTAGARARRMF